MTNPHPAKNLLENSTDFTEKSVKAFDSRNAWISVCKRLRSELGKDIFTSWFGRMELESIKDGKAFISVPTRFLKNWISSHYLDRITTALCAEYGQIAEISLSIRSGPVPYQRPGDVKDPVALKPAARTQAGASDQAQPYATLPSRVLHVAEPDAFDGSPLDRRLNFDSFLVGKSNQLAFAAAQRVAQAEEGAALLYNPLYFHAAVGLGKTHLIQAIAHEAKQRSKRVIYLTAEKFMYGFVSALKAQTTIAFKEKLRAIDLLIIDDVQFLQGKSIQVEFCHALNALIDAGKQVVIAADRPPSDLETLEERVRSRLAGGLCVEMSALDEALRLNILESRVLAARHLQPGFDVPPAVMRYVAHSITANGRDLDGAVNRLLAHQTLSGVALTVEMAEVAIRDLVRVREPKRVKIEDIQKLVATHYQVSRADILSSRRTANVVRPRQIAMFLAKTLTLRSLPEIGRRFGGRDHTTVLHAVRKIDGMTGSDTALAEELELLKRMLLE